MNMKTIFAGALAALLGMPTMANAQTEVPVTIIGSLINSYSYGKDPTTGSSEVGWHQTAVGGGAWIDNDGVAHATGAPNIGLMAINKDNVSTAKVDHWSIVDGASITSDTKVIDDFDWLIRDHMLYSLPSGVYVGGNTYYSFYMREVDAASNIDSEYGSEEYEVVVRKYTWDIGVRGRSTQIYLGHRGGHRQIHQCEASGSRKNAYSAYRPDLRPVQ